MGGGCTRASSSSCLRLHAASSCHRIDAASSCRCEDAVAAAVAAGAGKAGKGGRVVSYFSLFFVQWSLRADSRPADLAQRGAELELQQTCNRPATRSCKRELQHAVCCLRQLELQPSCNRAAPRSCSCLRQLELEALAHRAAAARCAGSCSRAATHCCSTRTLEMYQQK